MRANILQLGSIVEAVELTTGQDAYAFIRTSLEKDHWFYRDGLALQFTQIGNYKWTVHNYGKSLETLKETRSFVLEAAMWMVENTPCTCVLIFVKDNDLPLKFLLASCKAERIAILPEGNGQYDEILYLFHKEKLEEYRRLI